MRKPGSLRGVTQSWILLEFQSLEIRFSVVAVHTNLLRNLHTFNSETKTELGVHSLPGNPVHSLLKENTLSRKKVCPKKICPRLEGG